MKFILLVAAQCAYANVEGAPAKVPRAIEAKPAALAAVSKGFFGNWLTAFFRRSTLAGPVDVAAPTGVAEEALAAAPSDDLLSKREAASAAAARAGRAFDLSGAAPKNEGLFFESVAGGDIHYDVRGGPEGETPIVFTGGIGINNSFEALRRFGPAPRRTGFFLMTRGHGLSQWSAPTVHTTLGADALDLAKMILIARAKTGAARVDVAAHSFGTKVLQEMLVSDDPLAAAARKILGKSWPVNGLIEFDHAGRAPIWTRLFVGNVETSDHAIAPILQAAVDWNSRIERAGRLNPFFFFFRIIPDFFVGMLQSNRKLMFDRATAAALRRLESDLSGTVWEGEADELRREFLEDPSQMLGNPEAFMRRANDAFHSTISAEVIDGLKQEGKEFEIIHSNRDSIISRSEQIEMDRRFGIVGTDASGVLEGRDATGFARSRVYDAGHDFPLEFWREARAILNF